MLIWDTKGGYGLVTRAFHWLMALAIVAMFALGLWMEDLDYSHPWYNDAPDIHRSVGIILLLLLILRFAWRIANERPSEKCLSPMEVKISRIVHWGFYPLLFALIVSGYLISTAKGDPVSVFGWFSVPALLSGAGQEDIAGEVHEILAFAVIVIAAVHMIASLKHHFVDKSRILIRMWSGPPPT
jgi:cytochrome b561